MMLAYTDGFQRQCLFLVASGTARCCFAGMFCILFLLFLDRRLVLFFGS